MKAHLAVAVLPLLLACQSHPVREPPPAPFAGTKWLLVTERKPAGEPPYLEFGDGAVSGYSGCNRIMGRYIQDAIGAGAIVFSSLGASKRMCADTIMAVEERLLSVLRSSTSRKVTGDRLRIDGSAGWLEFVAEPPPAPPGAPPAAPPAAPPSPPPSA
jgi:heat shock protein HslJ